MEIGQALRFVPTSNVPHPSRRVEDPVSMEASFEDETDPSEADDVDDLLDRCRTGMPAHGHDLMKRSLQTGSPLMPTYSESFCSHGLCPLHPPERVRQPGDATSVEPSVSIGTRVATRGGAMEMAQSETDSLEFHDAMEGSSMSEDITF